MRNIPVMHVRDWQFVTEAAPARTATTGLGTSPPLVRPSQVPIQGRTMTKSAKNLQDLFHETLKDIYYAEKKTLTSLPKMAKAAHSPDLRAAFEKHERETEGQVERLDQVFALGERQGLRRDQWHRRGGKEIMKEFKGSPATEP